MVGLVSKLFMPGPRELLSHRDVAILNCIMLLVSGRLIHNPNIWQQQPYSYTRIYPDTSEWRAYLQSLHDISEGLLLTGGPQARLIRFPEVELGMPTMDTGKFMWNIFEDILFGLDRIWLNATHSYCFFHEESSRRISQCHSSM